MEPTITLTLNRERGQGREPKNFSTVCQRKMGSSSRRCFSKGGGGGLLAYGRCTYINVFVPWANKKRVGGEGGGVGGSDNFQVKTCGVGGPSRNQPYPGAWSLGKTFMVV